MKYVFLNDTINFMGIHAGSHNADILEKSFLNPGEKIIMEIPDNTVP